MSSAISFSLPTNGLCWWTQARGGGGNTTVGTKWKPQAQSSPVASVHSPTSQWKGEGDCVIQQLNITAQRTAQTPQDANSSGICKSGFSVGYENLEKF